MECGERGVGVESGGVNLGEACIGGEIGCGSVAEVEADAAEEVLVIGEVGGQVMSSYLRFSTILAAIT